jgi:ATP phosphoribosyltransferase
MSPEKSTPRLSIAIPKQEKLKLPVLNYLATKGFVLTGDSETGILSDSRNDIPNIRVEFVRAADALLLLQEKIADLAVIGSDVVDENTIGPNPRFKKVNERMDLEIGQCRFQLAVPNQRLNRFKTPTDLNGLRIATSYPNLLQDWLDKNKVTPSQIICREGGVESSVRLGMADVVADLVDTGRTLKKNNLTAIFDIARTSAKIYAPTSADYMSQLLADEFLRYLREPYTKKIQLPYLEVA